jgi:hypothetical protein
MIENPLSFPSQFPLRRGLLVMDARAASRPALSATARIKTPSPSFSAVPLAYLGAAPFGEDEKHSGSLRLDCRNCRPVSTHV